VSLCDRDASSTLVVDAPSEGITNSIERVRSAFRSDGWYLARIARLSDLALLEELAEALLARVPNRESRQRAPSEHAAGTQIRIQNHAIVRRPGARTPYGSARHRNRPARSASRDRHRTQDCRYARCARSCETVETTWVGGTSAAWAVALVRRRNNRHTKRSDLGSPDKCVPSR
jgi:hypothetical protein